MLHRSSESWLAHWLAETGQVYQGQFGEFTIDRHDRLEVLVYRSGLVVAALSFALATGLVGWQWAYGFQPQLLTAITDCYGFFCLGLGVSVFTIHIYLRLLHRVLQLFWAVGCLVSLALSWANSAPLVLTVYTHPLTILGVGFIFAALTGIFFKEAFCFNRPETKLLTVVVPLLLLGHLLGWLPPGVEVGLLSFSAVLFGLFALGKAWQEIPADIGDKSVFAYLQRRADA